MSSSDEDPELVEIRRARAARLGAAGLTIVSSSCVLQARLGCHGTPSFIITASASWLQSSLRNQLATGRPRQQESDEEDGPQVVEDVDVTLGGMLPSAFGKGFAALEACMSEPRTYSH